MVLSPNAEAPPGTTVPDEAWIINDKDVSIFANCGSWIDVNAVNGVVINTDGFVVDRACNLVRHVTCCVPLQ